MSLISSSGSAPEQSAVSIYFSDAVKRNRNQFAIGLPEMKSEMVSLFEENFFKRYLNNLFIDMVIVPYFETALSELLIPADSV